MIDGPTRIAGHLAVPSAVDDETAVPGIVVIHEAFGLTDDIVRIADRMADRGYLALAPDLFSWGPTVRCLVAAFRSLWRGHGRAVADVDACRRHLLARPDCNGRVGVVGFCLGGGFALLAARRGYDVAAPNYGHLPRGLPGALRDACPVVASYGADDLGLAGAGDRLAAALRLADVPHDVKTYAGVGHSFMNRHDGWARVVDRVPGVGYDQDTAADAWRRIDAFLDRHLRGAD
ncbi:MAG TPA: dienelactone hydrolase family protein [Euzebyales bacterium]